MKAPGTVQSSAQEERGQAAGHRELCRKETKGQQERKDEDKKEEQQPARCTVTHTGTRGCSELPGAGSTSLAHPRCCVRY